MGRKALELTGKVFGDIEVLERSGSSEEGAALWRCLCRRCGKEFVIEGYKLATKRSPKKNCGCEKDLTGGVYGALTVLYQAGKYKTGNRMYMCRCANCGQEKAFPTSTIKTCPRGCGCIRSSHEKMKEFSDAGVKAKFAAGDNGKLADMVAVKSDKAMVTSQTGVRGVYPDKKQPGTYRAVVQVAGERRVKRGFTSIERAKEAYDEMKEELIKKHGLG